MRFLFFIFHISIQAFALDDLDIPNRHAFTTWQPVKGYTTSIIDIDALPKTKMNCEGPDQDLYPTHPQQDLKFYHRFDWGSFNHGKLSGDDEACKISSGTKNTQGKNFCLMPDLIYHVIMSDLYRDRCGNYYRAYYRTLFLKKNESMGTLFSRGRTLYPNVKSLFPNNDFVVGQTYPMPSSEFLFLSSPFPEDLKKSEGLIQKALQYTHVFSEQTLLFNPK